MKIVIHFSDEKETFMYLIIWDTNQLLYEFQLIKIINVYIEFLPKKLVSLAYLSNTMSSNLLCNKT